ncbi:PREDICTED: autophagy-related protein 18g isoform X2 [Tarenaya hassleriana]|uniref:autophagy-related protein 18g isoform X2 n=1 Tax=Tarenaya hassleriana TaxID=28532 RepID=UPI00053C9ED8|nr:PREDICTED: autophagy-related protein 18g isoform X2 [Tarenaya hassleriana]
MKKGKGKNSGLLPNSLRIISSCLKTVSANAADVASSVRSAGASVAASISSAEDHKDQVTWAGFDKLEIGPSIVRHVLLLGYQNGFQAFDVEDASNFSELVSERDGPVSFLQMQPLPSRSGDHEGFGNSHPLLLVVAGDGKNCTTLGRNCFHSGGLVRDNKADSVSGNNVNYPTSVRFYSLKSHSYVHVLRFRSSVCMVRCSSQVVAVGLATQIYCFDALTLESKFSVLTYPIPQLVGQGTISVNVGYGPLAVGPRWLAYASKSPMSMKTGRLSSQSLNSSPGASPCISPGGSSLMARYAMESSKQLAAGLINLGDMGYKTFSKYCQELLPDGSSSPVSPNSIWKAGGLAGSDAENAGVVAVKDLVSGDIISQFKAHTSPISALCFDPSGTLLVTASVCGNNINIFQIMPSCSRGASGALIYEWRSSHMHLYKLHRGITSAIIQDICFSHHGQWVAVISSKGTCHIFVLTSFGGDDGLIPLSCEHEEGARFPVSSLPWCASYNQQSLSPSSPVSLSVVSRIKYSSFGWLNTVSSAATAATGKVFVPSGAVAAVFHKSVTHDNQRNSGPKSLEHILVYTPSGHVVQHELLPSVCVEPTENGSRLRKASQVQVEEDDLRVKVEPIQWWDVCRRSDWLEKEECLSEATTKRQQDAEMASNNLSNHEDSCQLHLLGINNNHGEVKSLKTCSLKPHESSHCYLSNAEVQMISGVLPVWQNSKISFHVMDSPRADSSAGGEFEIEKVTTHGVEIKQKKLLPVFDHFHSMKTTWEDRFSMNYTHTSKLESHQVNGKITQDTINCHSKPGSLSSTESFEESLSRRRDNLLDMDRISCLKSAAAAHLAANGMNMTNGFVHKPVIDESSNPDETRIEKHMSNGWSRPPNGICNGQTSQIPTFLASEQLLYTETLAGALLEEHCKAEENPNLKAEKLEGR